MKIELLNLLRCPATGSILRLVVDEERDGQVFSGQLVSEQGIQYPIRNFIPRFVGADNYAANFGFQWNRFRQTQLDSFTGHPISSDRFWAQSGWRQEDLIGKRVLDVGCGAGRFAEIALHAGAEVVALDYSGAVDACLANHRARFVDALEVVQGDIYHLPFAPEHFDFVYCFGVLQHTPDVKAAFMELPKQVCPGGALAVDVYCRHWSRWAHPKYWLRPLTTRINRERLFGLIAQTVPRMLSVSMALKRIPVFGKALARTIPVADYSGLLPLNRAQLTDWAILDTFDWLGPAYDQPQTADALGDWFLEAGFEQVIVHQPAHLSAHGRKAARV